MEEIPAEPEASSGAERDAADEYWRIYYDDATLARGDQLREVYSIQSGGASIHIDVYAQPARDAPVVIFNHGSAGYCRILVNLALKYFDRGYTVVLPDQIGQGLSGGRRGDYTVVEATQSIVDVARWAESRWSGPLYIAGGSIGGALTYYAAAAGAPVKAIACMNLVDFSTIDSWDFSKLAPLARVPGMAAISRAFMWLLTPVHGVRFPFSWIGRFDKLMDRRDPEFQALWDADPVPPRKIANQVFRELFNHASGGSARGEPTAHPGHQPGAGRDGGSRTDSAQLRPARRTQEISRGALRALVQRPQVVERDRRGIGPVVP